jgi:drug/metabolite transporter (DMT)-like permease
MAPRAATTSALRGILAGIAAATIWSAWYVLARHGVTAGGLGPFDLAALRFLVAAPLLLLILRRFPVTRAQLPLALIMALGIGPAFVIVVGTGFLQSPANFGGAVTAVCGVLFSLIGARLFVGERLGILQAVGIALSVGGLVLLAMDATGDGAVWPFLLGGLLWAAYGLAFRRSGLSAIEAVTAVAVLSALVYLPVYFVVAGARMWQADPAELLLQGLGQGVVTGIVALALHAVAVADLGATRGALFQSLVPPLTLVLSFFFIGEPITQTGLAATILVLVGVFLALRKSQGAVGAGTT